MKTLIETDTINSDFDLVISSLILISHLSVNTKQIQAIIEIGLIPIVFGFLSNCLDIFILSGRFIIENIIEKGDKEQISSLIKCDFIEAIFDALNKSKKLFYVETLLTILKKLLNKSEKKDIKNLFEFKKNINCLAVLEQFSQSNESHVKELVKSILETYF